MNANIYLSHLPANDSRALIDRLPRRLAALYSGFDGFRPLPRLRVLPTNFHLVFISATNYISCSRVCRVNFWNSVHTVDLIIVSVSAYISSVDFNE